MDILSESTPKANKEYVCMWCGGKINKGEVYRKQVVKGDYLYEWKNHAKCSELYYKLNMSKYDDGDGIDSESFMYNVYDFIYSKIDEEEHDKLVGEDAVDKAIEILKICS